MEITIKVENSQSNIIKECFDTLKEVTNLSPYEFEEVAHFKRTRI